MFSANVRLDFVGYLDKNVSCHINHLQNNSYLQDEVKKPDLSDIHYGHKLLPWWWRIKGSTRILNLIDLMSMNCQFRG